MENKELLNDEALENVVGGAATTINTTNWRGAHWQPANYPMGKTFVAYGYLWYRFKFGDTLGVIAQKYHTNVSALKRLNPATITDINKVYAGDAIIIRNA